MTATTLTRTMAERLAAISDPSRRWEITRRAMRCYLATVAEVNKTLSPEWRWQLTHLDPVTTEAEYRFQMDTVREIALEEWNGRSGSNCTEGTNRFLTAFGLAPVTCDERDDGSCDDSDCEQCYPDTTKRVTVTLTVTFTVTNSRDEYDTESDVRNYLRVEAYTGSVDDVDNTPDVEIGEITVDSEY